MKEKNNGEEFVRIGLTFPPLFVLVIGNTKRMVSTTG